MILYRKPENYIYLSPLVHATETLNQKNAALKPQKRKKNLKLFCILVFSGVNMYSILAAEYYIWMYIASFVFVLCSVSPSL